MDLVKRHFNSYQTMYMFNVLKQARRAGGAKRHLCPTSTNFAVPVRSLDPSQGSGFLPRDAPTDREEGTHHK